MTNNRLIAHVDPLRQARTGANKIRRLFRRKGFTVDVLPILIVWRPGWFAPEVEPQVIEGVVVVNGPTADTTSSLTGLLSSLKGRHRMSMSTP